MKNMSKNMSEKNKDQPQSIDPSDTISYLSQQNILLDKKVDLFEKRVKSRFSSYQLLMSEEEPEGKSFDLGYNLWRTKIIEMP